MPNKNQLLRYLIIDELLRNRQHLFPTKEHILATIQERTDATYSVSAFEKDLKIMREQFGAPIEFHHLERGYFYGYKQKDKKGQISYELDKEYRFMSISLSQKDLVALNFAESILQSFKNSQIFEDFSDAINKVLDAVEVGKQLKDTTRKMHNFIQPENAAYPEGRKWLADILWAIKNYKQIQFDYQKFSQNEAETRTLHPYLLKEFKGRWYVIGYNPDKERIATFALDRIKTLKISDFSVLYPEKLGFEAEDFYQNCYGITRLPNEKIEKIVLSFSPWVGHYLKSKPLHHTQKILIDTEQEFCISLKLIINPDLVSELLSFGKNVKVLAPERLQAMIKEELQNTMAYYF
ncbi:helix-turn-helix transcriptional regulator [Raineya orbicola]|jgi:predicted DNA-binding transcriptional regulator YafY|uniref:WYL domain n=1 Tax=Raineya orbicola TaxID=2016530 RepID=A0A2N3IBI4_9BACT|nr:WYL domain-containing protein [Raineya orbicola]PKQ67667.1 WYL domain [Raineya orbicola]